VLRKLRSLNESYGIIRFGEAHSRNVEVRGPQAKQLTEAGYGVG